MIQNKISRGNVSLSQPRTLITLIGDLTLCGVAE